MPRILVISQVFFPRRAVAAVRITQWCRHLPQLGWTPTVACRSYGQVASEAELAAFVDPSVRVRYLDRDESGSGPEQSRTLSIRSRVRNAIRSALGNGSLGKLVVPDVTAFFWRSRRERLRAIFDDVQPDVILSTSPPHSIHDAGRWLAHETGTPWVADFRDPYLFDVRYQPRGIASIRSSGHRRFEASIYTQASLIVHAIPAHARWAIARYPGAESRIVTIPNGVPEELLHRSGEGELVSARPGSPRSVKIIGACGPRESEVVAQAIALLRKDDVDITLRMVGPVPDNEVTLRRILGDHFSTAGLLAHRDALGEIASADVLISALSLERSRCELVSSKLFEFLASGRPVVQLNPTGPDEELTAPIGTVVSVRSPRVQDVVNAIRQAMSIPPAQLERQRQYVTTRYRRSEQTRELAGRLTELVRQ